MNDVPDLSRWIRPGDTVLWGQAAAEPLTLTRALVLQRGRFGRLRLFLGIGQSDVVRPEHADVFDLLSYSGSGHRALAAVGLLDILPVHYSELPALMRSGTLRVDVVMLQVSPPDQQGRCSLGLANDYLLAALDSARVVLAEVNAQVPWTYGARCVHADDLQLRVDASYAPAAQTPRIGAVEHAIAAQVAPWIEDGATLQTGVGAVPDAVLMALGDRRDLGVHSGAIGDGVAMLTEAGVVTNARKTLDRGTTICGLLMGSARLHRLAHRNPRLQLRPSEYTHDAQVIAAIDRFVAINSAIEVDLSGQVNAEVAGGVYVGAIGGAIDFMRGAQRSRGGLAIVALPSTAGARSRIVARLSGPVSTPRSDVRLVVTEHGVADLRGASLSARVDRLIAVADPTHRDALARDVARAVPATAQASGPSLFFGGSHAHRLHRLAP